MKCPLLFVMLVGMAPAFAQKAALPAAGKNQSPGLDSFSYTVLSAAIKMTRVAEDPKKGVGYFTTAAAKTGLNGEQIYTAPVAIAGFESTITLNKTDRVNNTSSWIWELTYASASTTTALKGLHLKIDSLLKTYKHKTGKAPNMVESLITTVNPYATPNPTASITLYFTKPLHNSKQQAQDSLLALYKPLMLQPAFAEKATRYFACALEKEAIFESDQARLDFLKEQVKQVASQNIDAGFEIFTGDLWPCGKIDYKALLTELPTAQQDGIRERAKRQVEAYYEEQKRKSGSSMVADQKKLVEEKKLLNECSSILGAVAHMYKTGVTVASSDSKNYIGLLQAVDCKNRKVTILIPGSVRKNKSELKVIGFDEYAFWHKHIKQYSRCTACGGEGGEMITSSSSKVKELPFGYFSGIETKVVRTTTSTAWEDCGRCGGSGWFLQ